MRRGSLREQVRAAARELDKAGAGFTFYELSDLVETGGPVPETSLRNAVKHLLAGGDLRRREDGRLGAVPHPAGAPGKGEVMWRFLRLNKQAPVKNLMSVAQATRSTVNDFIALLVRRELALRTEDGVRLLHDPGPDPPFDEARADRARDWREKQRAALAALDAAFAAVAEARMAVSQMEE
jgi:hypothetical protein